MHSSRLLPPPETVHGAEGTCTGHAAAQAGQQSPSVPGTRRPGPQQQRSPDRHDVVVAVLLLAGDGLHAPSVAQALLQATGRQSAAQHSMLDRPRHVQKSSCQNRAPQHWSGAQR